MTCDESLNICIPLIPIDQISQAVGVIYLQHYPTRDPARREQVPINSRGVTVFTTDHLAK